MSIFGELWNKISGSAKADQGVSADQPGGEPMKMPQQPMTPSGDEEKEAPVINPQPQPQPQSQPEEEKIEEKELETPETPEM